MSLRRTLLPTTIALIAAALLLTGCSSASNPDPAATSAAPVPTAEPETTAEATTEPTTVPAEATCETLIPQSLIEEFTAAKWTYEEDVFRLGEITLTDGLQCQWGDYTVATDHVQIFGWAPITESEATTAKSALIAAGWQTVDDTSGDFITENPSTAVTTDADGYGLTYEFGDGWVTFSDTKQGLILIEHPEA